MRRALCVIAAALILLCAACAMDTPVERSGLEYDEVCKWTKSDWSSAKEAERIEALFLMIDAANDAVDAGTSAQASLEGFDAAFENASDETTLKEIFDASSADEVTFEKDKKDEQSAID